MDEAGGMDTGVGSSLTFEPDADKRIELELASGPNVRDALGSRPSSASSFSHRLTTSSRLMTTELPDTPCARSARSLQSRPVTRLVDADEADKGPALLGPATAFGCL